MPKSILAIATIFCTLSCSDLTLPASATGTRCQLTPNPGNTVALAGKKCGLKRVYSRPRYKR
jgi:hypothetical protein